MPYTPRPTIRFGGSAFSTADGACNSSDFRSQTYFQLGNYIYLTSNDAISGNRPSFPNTRNYILTNTSQHAVISSNGYIIESSNTCSYPTLTISRKSYPNIESACKDKTSSTQTIQYKGSQIIGSSPTGRFKMQTARGGQNIIISGGQIISYETCGSEGSGVTYSRAGYSKRLLQIPTFQKRICNGLTPRQYFLGSDGVIYYSASGRYAYVPVGGSSGRYYFIGNVGYRLSRGRILDTITLSC